MAFAASKYTTLKDVTREWSVQSGELPPLTLRRICDWAICGAFPNGTFFSPTGQTIDILELHRAMRMATGVGAPINQDLAAELLSRTIVSKASLEGFCENLGIDPPPTITTFRSKVRRLLRKRRHAAPPDCPNSVRIVAQLEARCSAIGLMNTMKSMLPRPPEDLEPSILERVNERWLSYSAYAQSQADASGDPEVQRQLNDLKHEWDGPEASSGGSHSGSSGSGEATVLKSETPKKRGVGRPQGSGSLESDDQELTRKMREGILSKEFTSIAAAARAWATYAQGAGTIASKEARLRKRYAERYPD